MKAVNITRVLSLSLLLLSPVAFSDEVMPATDEDLQKFDQSLNPVQDGSAAGGATTGKGVAAGTGSSSGDKSGDDDSGHGHKKKAKKNNFGQIVQAEAHRLKEAGLKKDTDFGGWVSGQRRQDGDAHQDAAQHNNAAKEAREAARAGSGASGGGGAGSGGTGGTERGRSGDHHQ